MTTPFIKPAFSSGEISPSLYGRVDLNKWHAGCSVARNMYVSYKGGLASRAGTEFVGVSLQNANSGAAAPRLIKFQFNIFQSYVLEFGDRYIRFIVDGGYVTTHPKSVTGASQGNPCRITALGHGYSNGQWVFLFGLGGMIELNARIFVITNVTTNTFDLLDAFGNTVNSLSFPAYTSGGTAALIYGISTPYAAVDLPYLKFTQSADTMSLTCVNQATGVDYPPQDLVRHAADNWTLTPTTFTSSIAAPTGCVATPSNTTTMNPSAYSYVVTAVDDATGDESVASNIGTAVSSVDISTQFGTITISWTPPALNPGQVIRGFNVYKAQPSFDNAPQVGQLFGFVGSTTASATTWQDVNVIPDFVVTPPLHVNPFPGSGNYPGQVAYFQQRREYAATLNNPDTMFFSQPGSFTNFDSADPPIDSDAITVTPWSLQVNGVQWCLPMPGGLVVMTGQDAWQITGTAGAGSPITPAQISAQQQESNGSSAILQPLKINFDILFGQALGSIVRDLQYNFFTNIYAGTDITVLSGHLFNDRTLLQWAWAREPNKIVWIVRDDGKLLSLTYLKEQELAGWTRHDTNGLVVSVATASEPPVDAVYIVVKRYIRGPAKWAYFIERMDNRLWQSVEDCWCVDCGLALPQPTRNATLTASATQGSGGISAGVVIQAGSDYTAPAGAVVDLAGDGSGATVAGFGLSAGGIASVMIGNEGQNYTIPRLDISDATGFGAQVALEIDQAVEFLTSPGVWQSSDVGSVIRSGGGIATITQYLSATSVIANVTVPIAETIPNDPNNLPVPQPPGAWSITPPVNQVVGLNHLEGMEVAILADGSVIPNQVVTNGTITLPNLASQITVGLPFVAQCQSLHADMPGAMIQGKRKRIQGVTVRLNASRGVKMGQDQPIAAVAPFQAETPWGESPHGELTEIQDRTNDISAGNTIPLFTGDRYLSLMGDFSTPDYQPSPGMVAAQQEYPLPLEVLAFIPEVDVGDMPNA